MKDSIAEKSATKKQQIFSKKKDWDHISSKSSRKTLKKDKNKKSDEDFLELEDSEGDEEQNPFFQALNKNSGANVENVIKQLEPQFVKVYQEIFKTEKSLIEKIAKTKEDLEAKMEEIEEKMRKVEDNINHKMEL